MSLLFDLSILLSLYLLLTSGLGDLAFDDLGLILFDFGSDLGDFTTLGLFGDMARFGDLDFILPDC